MKSYNNNERAALALGLATLRDCNKYMCGAVNISELEKNPELNDYLLRPFGKDINRDKNFEKAIATAIIKSRNKKIPAWFAKRRADAFIESLRKARLDTLYENGISAKEYDRLKKDNYVSNTITAVKRVKGFAKRRGIRYAATTLLGVASLPVAITVGTGMLVWDILPTRHKKILKEKAAKIARQTKEKVIIAVNTLTQKGAEIATKVGEKLTSSLEKVAAKTEKVVNTVKATVNAVVDVVKATPVYQKAKEVATRTWKKITS